MKRCIACGDEKELSEFYQNPGCADGRVNQCRTCVNDRNRRRKKAVRDGEEVRSHQRKPNRPRSFVADANDPAVRLFREELAKRRKVA